MTPYRFATLAEKRQRGALGQPNHPGAAPPRAPRRLFTCRVCGAGVPLEQVAAHASRCQGK